MTDPLTVVSTERTPTPKRDPRSQHTGSGHDRSQPRCNDSKIQAYGIEER